VGLEASHYDENMTRSSSVPPDAASQDALQAAFGRLLVPLARLAVARGLPFAVIDEMFRAAFVAAAHAAHPSLPPHRRVSRVSASTGLNRREVTRLLAAQAEADRAAGQALRRTPAAMVFARWRSDRRYRTSDGRPRVLPRVGPAPSFESLAHDVTRDVHPRTLLEELLRLHLAVHNTQRDTVALSREAFVPHGDAARMAAWLGANVGDHLEAATANVLGRDPAHLEQAIAADGLSEASVAQVRSLLMEHWRRLSNDLVPLFERLIAEDDGRILPAGAEPAHRMRVGLFSFDTAMAPTPPTTEPAAARRRRKTLP
jgi:hypothetical protein